MRPSKASPDSGLLTCGRRGFLKVATAGAALAGMGALGGCAAPAIRSQSPEETATSGPDVRLVGDLASVAGTHPLKVEAVGLVTGLAGSGSDPEPSPQRAALLDEMQKRGVTYPNQVLASPTTELVLVRAFLRPGIQQGDRFDLEVRVPSRSLATSLRGGWLMQTRLQEMAVLNSRVREGKLLALAEGPILVDPAAQGQQERLKVTRGRILGGGVALESRQLRLVLKRQHRNVLASAQVGTAVNRRFHTFRSGVKEGVAHPKTDQYIELEVHPRYKDNIERYVQVVRSLPVRESASQQLARVARLERQLLDPITSAAAALRLEALGKEGAKALGKAIASPDLEVRFYAAEALAYLDESDAVAPLAAAARDVPAFRAYALAALSAMDDYGAYEALRELLDVPSAETRYGAFRALWAMNSRDPLVRGENLGDAFSYHLLDAKGPPMVHVTRSYRPEVVLFGHDQRLATPLVLEAGQRILINAERGDQITVSRFSPDEPDQKRVVSTKVDEVIRAIVDLGGTYPDVVQALQQAKAARALASKLEMDALPTAGRTYDRPGGREGEGHKGGRTVVGAHPLPDLFAAWGARSDAAGEGGDTKTRKNAGGSGEKAAGPWSWFGKMAGRDQR